MSYNRLPITNCVKVLTKALIYLDIYLNEKFVDFFMKMISHENLSARWRPIHFGRIMTTRPVNNSDEPQPTGRPQTRVEKKVVEDNNCTGKDIRALRKSRSITLQQLADQLNRSVGFISQIERGLSEPSLSDLRKIAALFGVPISLFFGQNEGIPGERGYIVRSGNRRKLGGENADLIEELLSPDLGGSFEIIRSEFAPGAMREEVVIRDTEEAGYLISGYLDLEIDGCWHKLNPGDSFRFAAVPMRWRNWGDEAAIVIWVITPPVY